MNHLQSTNVKTDNCSFSPKFSIINRLQLQIIDSKQIQGYSEYFENQISEQFNTEWATIAIGRVDSDTSKGLPSALYL